MCVGVFARVCVSLLMRLLQELTVTALSHAEVVVY